MSLAPIQYQDLPQADGISGIKINKCPGPIPTEQDQQNCPCVAITDYFDLMGEMMQINEGECKCFKPFAVSKSSEQQPIQLNNLRNVVLRCQRPGKCQISGEGTHLIIGGEESEVTISGFQYSKASRSAILIEDDAGRFDRMKSPREQLICNSEFSNNANDIGNGGAIQVGARSHAYIANSFFRQNSAARMGGAVYSEASTVHILDSVFMQNTAALGGAISSNQPTSTLTLAGNHFVDNSATLGTKYGMAVAANGRVNDWGENDSNPQDFMCLACTLVPGSRPAVIAKEDVLNTFLSGGQNINDNNQESANANKNSGAQGFAFQNTDINNNPSDIAAGIDVEYALSRYERNPEFEDYDLYDASERWGPFHLKLYFGDGYMWQDSDSDLNYCMQSKFSWKRVEGREEPLELYKCRKDEDRQRFVAVGRTIRLADDEDLCMTFVNGRGVALLKCNGSIFQDFDRVQKDDEFKISPRTDHRRCMTNHHHPRNNERIYLDYCDLAEKADSAYWETKWQD